MVGGRGVVVGVGAVSVLGRGGGGDDGSDGVGFRGGGWRLLMKIDPYHY